MSRSPVILEFHGQDYTVPSNKIMDLIEAVEDVITLDELVSAKGQKRGKIARAFSVALAFAGAKEINSEMVYETMFGSDASLSTTHAVTALLSLMVPPESVAEKLEKKPKPRGQKNAD